MSELKECPFCGQQPKETKYREFGKNPREYSLYHCLNEGCPSYFTKPGSMTAEDWNTRPIEDALRERITELEAECNRLKLAYKQYVKLSNDVENERDQAQATIVELIELAQNMRFRLAVYDDIDPTLAEWSDFLFKFKNDGA